MGMFDEVKVLTLSHPNFNPQDIGTAFQTKDLGSDMSRYLIFNNRLYKESEGLSEFLEFTGDLNLYCYIDKPSPLVNSVWLEYDMSFVDGELINVVPHPVDVQTKVDYSEFRLDKSMGRVLINIDVTACSAEKQDAVMAKLTDEKLEQIRAILEEPTATISYPAKRSPTSEFFLFRFPARYSQIYSFAQTIDDLEAAGDSDKRSDERPDGSKMIVIDEVYRMTKSPLTASVIEDQYSDGKTSEEGSHDPED